MNCLLWSFSQILNADPQNLCKEIGHDGTGVMGGGPRGFMPDEFYPACIARDRIPCMIRAGYPWRLKQTDPGIDLPIPWFPEAIHVISPHAPTSHLRAHGGIERPAQPLKHKSLYDAVIIGGCMPTGLGHAAVLENCLVHDQTGTHMFKDYKMIVQLAILFYCLP